MHKKAYVHIALFTLMTSITLSKIFSSIPESEILKAELAISQKDLTTAYTIWQKTAALNTRACFNAGVYALHTHNSTAARAYFTRAAADDTYTIRLAALRYLQIIGVYTTIQMLWQACLVAPSLVWILLALLLALGMLYIRTRSRLAIFVRTACICSILCCLYQYHYGIQVPAVVLHESALLSGPDTSFTPQALITSGQKISILKQQDSWALITNGTHTGWIANDHIIC